MRLKFRILRIITSWPPGFTGNRAHRAKVTTEEERIHGALTKACGTDIKPYLLMIRTDDVLQNADQLFKDNRYQEMIDLLNRTILEESTTPELYFLRGIAWMQLQRYDEAIDDLTKAVDLRPDYFRAWQNRGLVWSFKRKYNKAIADLNQAIELRPNHASTYRHLGNALLQTKDYDQAIQAFTKAIELDPEAYDHYHNRGSAWRKKGEYQKAIADYNRAIALRPNHGRTFAGLGIVYDAIKERELASIHYKRAYYFGFDKIQLARIFTEHFPAPYIAKAIFASNGEGKGVEADLSTIQWLTSVCKNWDAFLDRLRRKGYPATHPEKYYSLEAIVHYYMGDPITAYRIFDTQFDAEEHPYSLSLRDQYYLVLAALDFKEPDTGLAYAIEQVRQKGDKPAEAGQSMGREPMGEPWIDSYYAGHLFLLHNDLQEALQRFDACGDLLPAWYGKLAVYQLLGDEEGMSRTLQEIAVAGDPFLDGIEPLVIPEDMAFEEMLDKIFAILPYYELKEEIEKARVLLGGTPVRAHLAFHELLKL